MLKWFSHHFISALMKKAGLIFTSREKICCAGKFKKCQRTTLFWFQSVSGTLLYTREWRKTGKCFWIVWKLFGRIQQRINRIGCEWLNRFIMIFETLIIIQLLENKCIKFFKHCKNHCQIIWNHRLFFWEHFHVSAFWQWLSHCFDYSSFKIS